MKKSTHDKNQPVNAYTEYLMRLSYFVYNSRIWSIVYTYQRFNYKNCGIKKVPKPPGTVSTYLDSDFLEERVFSLKRVFLSGADIHVSVVVSAVLSRPTSAPMPTSDLGHIFTKDHNVVIAEFRVFFAGRVVMIDGMKMGWGDFLVFMPRTDRVRSVFLAGSSGGGGGGSRRHCSNDGCDRIS